MSGRFDGRVALVTGGAGAGIGGAVCGRLAAEGAAVVVMDDHERRTAETVERLRSAHPDARVMGAPGSVADRTAVDELIPRIGGELGPLDVLVNNAAINVQGSVFDYDPADFDAVIDVDLTACWYLMRAVLPGMRELGRGSIVNVTSVSAYTGGRGREGPYSAAKAALNELTRS